ncbi:phage tail sheath protein [Bacillus pseudomycoides]|uniref:Phage tail sheath protein n=2 Tax=Bacillus pseudomycoides TaxID=64104 RepID=A0AA91ZSG7_9BACI|nr:phage tail sheath C-terminal domain-containing protein [Bacillus sp. AFS098217]PEB56241.1 phage tail sheath protein [Bacillus sp. AFS098217]PED81671.1 phage tail sheath protein [Bacillus pseudomycoides]
MGLPQINITFAGKAKTALDRSKLGIVLLILKDDTNDAISTVYKNTDEVKTADWSADNFDYIQQAFEGNPSKVICERVATSVTTYDEVLLRLKNKKFNYLAIPQIKDTETASIVTWIKTKREKEKKTFKAVLPNSAADHEGIINFTTSGIKVGEKDYTTAEYTARVAGILAGLPFTRSATYYVLPEVSSITEIEDPDEAVDNGELILINDGEHIKIGRGVNSLKTTTDTKNDDFKSIRVMETMDMVRDDIYNTFNEQYVGKVNNVYDNQVLFITALNAYFTGLSNESILDDKSDNKSWINVTLQRKAWEGAGVDTSDWDDQKVKEMVFKRNVFLAGTIKIVDTMEDLDFQIAM